MAKISISRCWQFMLCSNYLFRWQAQQEQLILIDIHSHEVRLTLSCPGFFGHSQLEEGCLVPAPVIALSILLTFGTSDIHSDFCLLTNCHIFSGKVTKFGLIIFLPL